MEPLWPLLEESRLPAFLGPVGFTNLEAGRAQSVGGVYLSVQPLAFLPLWSSAHLSSLATYLLSTINPGVELGTVVHSFKSNTCGIKRRVRSLRLFLNHITSSDHFRLHGTLSQTSKNQNKPNRKPAVGLLLSLKSQELRSSVPGTRIKTSKLFSVRLGFGGIFWAWTFF